MNLDSLSPIQRKMLEVLSDGMPHTREELHACLWDEQGALSNIKAHITAIRAKLRPIGEDILCEVGYKLQFRYRHVRLLASAVNGKR